MAHFKPIVEQRAGASVLEFHYGSSNFFIGNLYLFKYFLFDIVTVNMRKQEPPIE